MRLAFESAGAECVFSSDWDKYAQQTYAANFGHTPAGNIREIQASDIPDHDILVGGFPCQPFSISGVSKKNSLGREHGFRDDEAPSRVVVPKAIFPCWIMTHRDIVAAR
jgi:DNA (cytosine-5)-methyltransferase 1